MQYIFSEDAGEPQLNLSNELYKYIVKVRRFKVDDELKFRNLKDDNLYRYKIQDISKRSLTLSLVDFELSKNNLEDFEIFWCVIDNKTIEKSLPLLNQIGVTKITFLYCDRSQKNFKLDFQRFKSIVINSNQQCGRVHVMEFGFSNSLHEVLEQNSDIYILDFGGDTKLNNKIKKVLIGCEGGFSDKERELFSKNSKISFKKPHILKSETACIAIASKLIL